MLFQLLWLLLLGLITYLLLRRGVAAITKTSIWLLWLVMMTPAFSWVTWVVVHGDRTPMPISLIVMIFVLCLMMYGLLVQLGRLNASVSEPVAEESDKDVIPPSPTKPATPATPPRPITQDEETTLRTCFPWTVFPLQNLEYRPQAVICRGQLRSQPEVAYETIREKVEDQFGDRFVIVFQKDFNEKPFFAVILNPYRRDPASEKVPDLLTRPLLAIAFLLITLFTTTVAGVAMVDITTPQWLSNPSLLLQGLAYAVPLMSILGGHEFVHYAVARHYQIRTTLPFFIPMPFFLGTFGAMTQMRSPIPHRKALFDINAVSPWVGFIITLGCLWWGLSHSEVIPIPPEGAGIFNFNALDPSFSFLLTVLSKLALGAKLTVAQAIDLHPVAIAGYLGFVVTAFNLLPIGQLNGGHIVHAVFGRRTAIVIGQITRFLVLALSLVQGEFLVLAILLFFLPLHDEPALNDVSELDNIRDFMGLATLTLLLFMILPMPQMVAAWMQY
ncbi:MAG: site-2 protease family protein [Microcoleaceae cyanobacterium]